MPFKFATSSPLLALAMIVCAATAMADERHINDKASDAEPLEVGATVPEASLLTLEGDQTKLRTALDQKPTVIVFFRGAWCPFCTKHLASLGKVLPELNKRGYQVIAISPDTPAAVKKLPETEGVTYYSDPRIEAAARFGLAFRLDSATSKRYKGFGIEVQPIEGIEGDILPVPAVFIVDKTGAITFVHAEEDYKKRLSAEKILEAAR
jgi:peroxiredoxin